MARLFDVEVIGGSLLGVAQTSPGQMMIFREDPAINGGTFDSTLPVEFNLIFTAINVPNSFTIEQFGSEILMAQGVPWAATIPVPAALPLLLTGLVGLGLIGWRKRKAA